MASHEHLQQLDDEDDSSTTTSSSTSLSDDDTTSAVSTSSVRPQEVNNGDAMEVDTEVDEQKRKSSEPPKRRLKLQLRLPKPTKAASPTVENISKGESDEEEDEEQVVKATIVQSDGEDDEEVVEATVIEEAPTAHAVVVPSSSAQEPRPKPATKTRRSPTPLVQVGRPVRLPPMSSPGLLIPPSAGVFRGDADVNGFTTPSSVFSRAMSLAGYSTEGRTQNPHRGSSVQRVVDDMFDSNVLFTNHFPDLVEEGLWSRAPSKTKQPGQGANGAEDRATVDMGETLPQLLIRALSKPKSANTQSTSGDVMIQDTPGADMSKRTRKSCSFMDMIPVSLTTPYPESYIQKRLKYVEQVQARERSIVASQEAAQAREDAMEIYEEALAAYNNGNKRNHTGGEGNGANGPPEPPPTPTPVEIPLIPTPPSPPRQSPDLGSTTAENADDPQHPIYLPKGKENFVAHLDKNCFHITDGRYYALATNTIADPHFVGPNAPGINGLNLSGATGLATSYVGSSGSSGAGASQAYYGGSVGGGSSGGSGGGSSKNTGESAKGSANKGSSANSEDCGTASVKVTKKRNDSGPSPTSTSTDLKKFMEQDNADLVEQMKVCIIRSAVYASRTGMHGGSFVGSDNETYPDVSKAFAAHAGLRPCNRCKNNKQGAYHCRLRRKHKDVDYDGGTSWEVLAPLFEQKIEDLVQK